MSHLLAPQEEKKDTRASQSAPAVSDTSFLVPPQEEKADVAALRGEQARIDQGTNLELVYRSRRTMRR